jgi:Flp pilus assembly pilin Flp
MRASAGNTVRRLMRSEGGAAAAEFALVVVALLTILFGIIEGSWVFFNYVVITNEAREAARWGTVRVHQACPNPCYTSCNGEQSVQERYEDRAPGLLGGSIMSFSCSTTGACPGMAPPLYPHITVTIDDQVPLLTPMMQGIFGGATFHLQACSTMRSER